MNASITSCPQSLDFACSFQGTECTEIEHGSALQTQLAWKVVFTVAQCYSSNLGLKQKTRLPAWVSFWGGIMLTKLQASTSVTLFGRDVQKASVSLLETQIYPHLTAIWLFLQVLMLLGVNVFCVCLCVEKKKIQQHIHLWHLNTYIPYIHIIT